MARLRVKYLAWIMSFVVFIWFVVTLFSEKEECIYDLDQTYYYDLDDEHSKKADSNTNFYKDNVNESKNSVINYSIIIHWVYNLCIIRVYNSKKNV